MISRAVAVLPANQSVGFVLSGLFVAAFGPWRKPSARFVLPLQADGGVMVWMHHLVTNSPLGEAARPSRTTCTRRRLGVRALALEQMGTR